MRLGAHPLPLVDPRIALMPRNRYEFRHDWIDINGNTKGHPLVMVAGLGGCSSFWAEASQHFLDRFHVLSYDQPGCGRREAIKGPVTIQSLAEDLVAICEMCFDQCPVTLIGHSTGGTIVQTFAALRPGLTNSIVLSGTWLCADNYMHELFGYRQALLQRAPELAAGLTTLMTEATSGVGTGALAPKTVTPEQIEVLSSRIDALLAFDGAATAERIDARTLVIGARDDRIVPLSCQIDLHGALQGSDIHIIDEGGHFFPRTQAEIFSRTVRDWLEL